MKGTIMISRKFITFVLLVLCLIFAGCGIPSTKPILNQGVWGDATRGEVFDACAKALHFKEYMIQGISREAGIISTDWYSFRLKEEDVDGQFRMNILVYKGEEGKATVSVKIKASWKADSGETKKNERTNVLVNNKISGYLKSLFAEIEKILGQPSFTGNFTLYLE